MSEKRLVIIRGLLDATNKTTGKPWLAALAAIPESSVVIFADVMKEESLKKHAIFSHFSTATDTKVYLIPSLRGADFQAWAMKRAQEIGVAISPSLMTELVRRTGDDPTAVDAELRKLVAYCAGQSVSLEALELLVRPSPQSDVFAFLDALSTTPKAALHKLHSERASGSESFQLFGMLARHLRLMVASKLLKADDAGAPKRFGLHPYALQKSQAAAKRHTLARLLSWHDRLGKRDLAMKSGLAPELAVDQTIADFVTPS